MINIKQAYKSRPIRFFELADIDGWKVKVYSISAKDQYVPEWLVREGKTIALKHLNEAAEQQDGYGMAVLILHEGADGNYILIDWWFGENMLRNHVYASTSNKPHDFNYITLEGVAYCVWELEVMHFERKAWIEAILSQATSLDIEGYLLAQLNVDI